MARYQRVLLGFGITIVSIIVAVLVVFAIDRATNGGEILGDVTVGGIQLGGLGEFEATEAVRELEARMASEPVTVVVAGHVFELDPTKVGFDIDEQAVVAAALEQGRKGNLLGQFNWWLGHFGDDALDLEVPYTYDESAIRTEIDDWQFNGIDDPAFPGDVWLDGENVVYAYPQSGTGIDADSSVTSLGSALGEMPRPAVELPTRQIQAALTNADVDAVVAEVGGFLSKPIRLQAPDLKTVTVPRSVVADSLVVRREDNTVSGKPEFRVTLRGAPILDYVTAFDPYLETDPVDAEIIIDDVEDTVEIVPSVPVTEPDPVLIPQAAWKALNSVTRTASVPFRTGREATLSTADVAAYGINGKISEFTTFHSCCQARVINIQAIADAVDGAWILPGEVFSLNDYVGKRTTAKGYVCAGALIGGEVVEEGEICIGGGTSQFTTTLYNAAFFAGLEDIFHFPHTIWFSRYPEGREATLGFPNPDLVFRNNTDNVVVIKTSHTDTSITVKMFGDNGGIQVEAGLSNRYRFTSPRTTRRPSDEVPADCADHVVQNGTPGWSVDVYRYITYPDGTETTETWTARYEGYWEITEYNENYPPGPDCVPPGP